MSERLGCGATRVLVQERNNGPSLGELPYSLLRYGYRLDDMSSGEMEVPGGAYDDDVCCSVLSRLDAWSHELSVWRDDQEVFVGPIVQVVFRETGASISARDLFQWFERRNVQRDLGFTETDLADIFQTVADHAQEQDPFGLVIHAQRVGIDGNRDIKASEAVRAADVLRELSRSGLDFTVMGRTMIVGLLEVGHDLGLVSGEFLTDGVVSVLGSFAATEVVVQGHQATSTRFVNATAGGVSPTYGLLTQTFADRTIRDQGSAQAAADTRLDLLSRPPESLQATLTPEAPFSLRSLIPGSVGDVRAQVGCRRVTRPMRLESVDARVEVSEEGTTESIGVQFQPIGTEG